MRKIAANYIYPIISKPIKNGVIITDDSGTIVDIIDNNGELKETESLEFYNGILVPGFVNAHCHIELSHMKGVLTCKKQGLPAFIDEIISKRFFPDNLEQQIKNADDEMQQNGIVAVGDISNTDDSFNVKHKSPVYYHTFIETFTLNNAMSDEAFGNSIKNLEKLNILNLPATIVPHAAYSVPDKLFEKITNHKQNNKKVTSIHNQETESENELFLKQSGKLKEVLMNKGFELSDFTFKNKNSLQTFLHRFNANDNILLIHNSFTKKQDIEFAENYSKNIYWVFCPNSNLYIEDIVPDINIFLNSGCKICVGTDSLSSNYKLSVLDELKTIVNKFPKISFNQIIKWATLNGAKALNIKDKTGSFEIGKKPGINLITDFNFEKMTISEKSKIKVLI